MASRGEPWCNSKALLPYDLEVVGLNLGNNLSPCWSKTVYLLTLTKSQLSVGASYTRLPFLIYGFKFILFAQNGR